MPMLFFGDVTVDNYEYHFDDSFVGEYEEKLGVSLRSVPKGSPSLQNRFVASVVGGVYLLARFSAIAASVWIGKKHRTDKDKTFPLKLGEIEPCATVLKNILLLQNKVSMGEADFDEVIRLLYRIEECSDSAYRVSKSEIDGLILPSFVKNAEHSPPVLLPGSDGNGLKEMELRLPLKDMVLSPPLRDEAFTDDHITIVINDSGMGLRGHDTTWIDAMTKEANSWVVVKSKETLKLSDEALSCKELLNSLGNKFDQRVVLILEADDLRLSGATISRSLSWERAVRDAVRTVEKRILGGLDRPPRAIVITFDYDAALYLDIDSERSTSVSEAFLLFSTSRGEGEFSSQFSGAMPGSQSVFCSVFAALLHTAHAITWSDDLNSEDVESLLTYSLIAKQRMLGGGFAEIDKKHVFRKVEIGEEPTPIGHRATAVLMYHEAIFALPVHTSSADPEQVPLPFLPREQKSSRDPLLSRHEFRFPGNPLNDRAETQKSYGLAGASLNTEWLQSNSSSEIIDVTLERIAGFAEKAGPFVEYVQTGKFDGQQLPVCTLGKVKSINSGEIEGLRTIRRLMDSYVTDPRRGRSPLGVAVFGQPGSGKSFSVKSVLATLRGEAGELVKDAFIECNLSGLNSPDDLATYFQEARDLRLRNKVPVLFFDEFDCSVSGHRLFWLKYFLAPLQDGIFTAGHKTHPIGKSIFVFAGGTCHTFDHFQRQFSKGKKSPNSYYQRKQPDQSETDLDYTKGKDFLSRLQGHIDIAGLSPMHKGRLQKLPSEAYFQNADLHRFTLRRAILLREILGIRAPGLFSKGTVNIDSNVAKAFLGEPHYQHGVRSIEALIRMSSLRSGWRFSAECLPPKEQLSMHVSEKFFNTANNVQ